MSTNKIIIHECPYCSKKLTIKNAKEHFLLEHKDAGVNSLKKNCKKFETELNPNEIELIEKYISYKRILGCPICKEKVKYRFIKHHVLTQHKSIENDRKERIIERINLFFTYKSDLKKIESLITDKYTFNNGVKYTSIRNRINSLLNFEFLEIGKKEKLRNLIMECEKSVNQNSPNFFIIEKLIKMFDEFTSTLPTLAEFNEKYESKIKKADYRCIYITWRDIIFDNGKIYINPQKKYLKPLPIKSSQKILNQIKVEYYQRLYKEERYKIVVRGNFIDKDSSKDLLKIQAIVNNIKLEDKKISIQNTKYFKHNYNKKTSKKDFLERLTEANIDKINKYLREAASVLRITDFVKAIIENNNGIEEESIIFVFNRGKKVLVLWENINPDRAGYLFKINKDNYKSVLSKIITLVKSNSRNKREKLFKGINLQKGYKIECSIYKSLVHKENMDYLNTLKSYINFL